MTFGERVRFYRKQLGWDQKKLAAAIRAAGGEASQSTISDIERGISTSPKCIPQLAEVFGVTEKQLRDGDMAPSALLRSNVRPHVEPVDEDRPLYDISGDKSVARPINFVGRLAETSRTGGWVIYPERTAGIVELGPVPAEAPRIFKVEVIDAENSPVYEPRDVLFCDPDRQPLATNYCVFVGILGADGGIPALLGKLIQANNVAWTMKPYAGEEIVLPRMTWPHAWVVFRCDRAI